MIERDRQERGGDTFAESSHQEGDNSGHQGGPGIDMLGKTEKDSPKQINDRDPHKNRYP